MSPTQAVSATIDGNEAAARIAHNLSEVIAVYPPARSPHFGLWGPFAGVTLWT